MTAHVQKPHHTIQKPDGAIEDIDSAGEKREKKQSRDQYIFARTTVANVPSTRLVLREKEKKLLASQIL